MEKDQGIRNPGNLSLSLVEARQKERSRGRRILSGAASIVMVNTLSGNPVMGAPNPNSMPGLPDGAIELRLDTTPHYFSPITVFDSWEREKPQSRLTRLVDHFNESWAEEELPWDWENLGRVGFSMDSQMNLLKELDFESRELWMERTEADTKSFAAEYLIGELVHPSFYREVIENSRTFLMDEKYKKAMIDMVSSKERNGAVVDALKVVEEHMLSGDEMAGFMSPSGWTGLETDRGEAIEYQEAFFFGFKKYGEKVLGFGIKTDFSLRECKAVIKKLTGEDLPAGSSIEDYVRAVAKIKPEHGINSPEDLVQVLQEVRGTEFAFNDRAWDEVYKGLARLDEIYALGEKANEYIKELRDFVLTGEPTEFQIKQALAATVLRLSELYLYQEKQTVNVGGNTINIFYPESLNRSLEQRPLFGQVLKEVEKIPGCAGGGTSQMIISLIDRFGVAGSILGIRLPEDKYGSREVECPDCGKISIRPKDTLIPACVHCKSKSIAC